MPGEHLSASFGRVDDEMRVFSQVLRPHPEQRAENPPQDGLASLELSFGRDELASYTEYRKIELTRKSADWIERAPRAFWLSTRGTISRKNLNELRESTFAKYTSQDSTGKVLAFARAFLVYLTKTHLDVRYRAFDIFLEQSRRVKKRKNVTNRIVTKEDIEHVLDYIKRAEQDGTISSTRARQYIAFTVFGAFTGQRSVATIMKLTVGQFREALAADQPVILIECSQDKIRMEHYVPLHQQVISAIKPLLDARRDDEPMFQYNSFCLWITRQKIAMSRFNGHFVLGDLRKFCEQHGDILCWNESNRAYILTHGVGGIQWAHYKRPLPEHVYDIYIQHWVNVRFRI
jgi:CRP-like cAMP-binding protein